MHSQPEIAHGRTGVDHTFHRPQQHLLCGSVDRFRRTLGRETEGKRTAADRGSAGKASSPRCARQGWSMRDLPIDETVLEGLRLLQRKGRPDIAKRVVVLFLESAPRALNDLQTGAVNNDLGLLRYASHVLKSSSAAVGAVRLSARCKQLEEIARAGSLSDAGKHVQ